MEIFTETRSSYSYLQEILKNLDIFSKGLSKVYFVMKIDQTFQREVFAVQIYNEMFTTIHKNTIIWPISTQKITCYQ